jgi:hypothetical protein
MGQFIKLKHMKKILLLIAIFAFVGANYAQDSKSCYDQYYEIFKIRGAEEVKNGEHKSVIFSMRNGNHAECFYGKVRIDSGYVKEMYIEFEDGNYEPYILTLKTTHKINIQNGISRTVITKEEEIFNIFFVNHIKPPKKKYKRAATPKISDFK